MEHAGYFNVSGAHLYTVLHELPDPVARVLLVEPLASERHNSYLPCVRWARYPAKRGGTEVLRYDYRGIAESTGVFEQMTFTAWCDDVQMLAEWVGSRQNYRLYSMRSKSARGAGDPWGIPLNGGPKPKANRKASAHASVNINAAVISVSRTNVQPGPRDEVFG
jgi:hypothetical protein